jgi:hypothetical protein
VLLGRYVLVGVIEVQPGCSGGLAHLTMSLTSSLTGPIAPLRSRSSAKRTKPSATDD